MIGALCNKQYGFWTGMLVQRLVELVMRQVQFGAALTGLSVQKSVLLAYIVGEMDKTVYLKFFLPIAWEE